MNMSYCRFGNTYKDLLDCQNALEDFVQNDENCISSDSERRYAKQLIALAKEIADNYEESDIDRQSEMFEKEEEEEDD